MPAADSPIVKARRDRLRAWIRDRYKGSRKDFIADAALRGHKIDPTEVSNLQTGRKSFGEKKAAALEAQGNMPAGYLVTPLAASSSGKQPVNQHSDQRSADEKISGLENDIAALNLVLGTLMATMVQHRPAEAVEAAAALRKTTPAEFADHDSIRELISVLEAKPARKIAPKRSVSGV